MKSKGMGHAAPPSIAEYLDFVNAPRGAAAGGFFVGNYLTGIRSVMAISVERGNAAMLQLWTKHPEVRTSPEVLGSTEENGNIAVIGSSNRRAVLARRNRKRGG